MKNIEEKIINQTATLEEISQWEKHVFENFSNIDLDKVKILRESAEKIKHNKALESGVYTFIQNTQKLLEMEQNSKEIKEYLALLNSIKTITPQQFALLKPHCKDNIITKISQISSITPQKPTEKKAFYTQEDHLLHTPARIQAMYLALKEAILSFGEIEIEPTRVYIIFRGSIRSVGSVLIQKKQIKVYPNFKKGEVFLDPKGIVKDISENGIWGRDYEMIFNNLSELEDIVKIMRQSYKING